MYHRQLVRLTGAAAQIPVAQMTVRVASSSGAVDTSKVTEWPGGSLPPHVAGYQQGFFNRYQDPTENRAQLDKLAAEFPNLVTAVNLPHLSPGYQRKAQTVVGGWAGAGTTGSPLVPFTNQTGSLAAAEAPKAVVLTSKAWGHEGGNGITAQLVAGTGASAPLAVEVTGRAIKVDARHQRRRRVNSTAAQVVAAINAQPRGERARHAPRPTAATRAPASRARAARCRRCRTSSTRPRTSSAARSSSACYRIGAHPRRLEGRRVLHLPGARARVDDRPDRASRPPSGSCATTRPTRRPRSCSTTSRSSSTPTATPTAGTTRCTTSPRCGATCPTTATRHEQRPAGAQHLGRRPQPQLHRVHALRRRVGRRLRELHGRQLLRPVGGLRARDQERHVDRGHVPEHQVREQHARLRRLLHVVAGRVPRRRQAHHVAGAEHRRREVLLRGRREDPRPHQGDPRHGHPAGAHGPDRGRALLGRRQLGRRPLVPQGHHRLRLRDRRRPLHLDRDGHAADPDGLPAAVRHADRPARTRAWPTRAATRRWSSPRATTA